MTDRILYTDKRYPMQVSQLTRAGESLWSHTFSSHLTWQRDYMYIILSEQGCGVACKIIKY